MLMSCLRRFRLSSHYQNMTKWRLLWIITMVISTIVFLMFVNSAKKTIYGIEIDLDDSLKRTVIHNVLKVSSNIAKSARQIQNGEARHLLQQSFYEMNTLLVKLGHQETSEKPVAVANSTSSMDVCQEKYSYDRLNGDFPYFYKGFDMEDCGSVPEFHTLLTIVYNFVSYNRDDLKRIPDIIRAINKVYPKLEVIAAIPSTISLESTSFNHTKLFTTDVSTVNTDIWSDLISKVTTKYVYIGRNVVHFTWFDRLERLVREINNINAYVVASASRTLHSGKWSHGCEQSILRNYTLVYRHGYDLSMEECMLCHHVHGPFVAKTELFKKLPLHQSMGAVSGFALWFLAIKNSGKNVVVCPDSMAFVRDDSRQSTVKEDWKELAKFIQVERVFPRPGVLIEFDCEEANTGCPAVQTPGLALSNCCMKELSDNIKLVFKKCKEFGFLCELQEGTLLGAVKFNGILPWELDADLTLHSNNYTTFADKLKPIVASLGYKWKSDVGVHQIFSAHFKVELFTQGAMDSVSLARQGISPTLVDLDGVYVPAPESPGLFVRNRYGREVYQHVQHWSQNGKDSSWDFYGAKQFNVCPNPGQHNCLDQFIADGNIMFKTPLP